MAMPKNSAPIRAIHQPWLDTPQIITAKVAKNRISTSFWVPLSFGSSNSASVSFRKNCRSLSRCAATTERFGSALTFAA